MSASGVATARNGARTGSACGAGIRQQRQHHELPVLLLGQERHGRCRHDVDHGAQLLGCRLGKPHELGDGVNRRGTMSIPPTTGQRAKAVGELRRHAETAATAAHGPEEVGMVLRVRDDDASIGGDELDREQVVDGQPVRPADEPGTTAKVMPPTPTEAVSPNPMTSPWCPAAAVTAPAVAPRRPGRRARRRRCRCCPIGAGR